MSDSPLKNATGVVTVKVLSNGAEIDETAEVLSVQVDKRINRIASAKLVLSDGDMPSQDFPLSNEDTFKPGSEIEIKAGYAGDLKTLFKGVVIRHGIKIDGDNFSRLVIECRDKAVAMTVGRKNASYLKQKDSDVISSILGNYSGLSSSVDTTSTEHPELVQYYCTDWDFILSRAEANGLLVLVDDGKVSVIKPTADKPSLKVTYGEDLIDFAADIDARSQLQKVEATAWNPATQELITETASASAINKQGNLQSSDLSKVLGLSSYRLQSNALLQQNSLEAWAKGRQLKADFARIRGRMRFQGNAQARIAESIELAGVGKRFNGDVFVTSVHHDLSKGNWITEVGFGLSEQWFAEQREVMAPPASALVPGVQGLQIGVVKQVYEDPEKRYRIQVSVPLLDGAEDIWARLSKFYASEGIGAFFLPEIGDEVVLGFMNSDPASPVILGSLYSGKNTPPYDPAEGNNTKAIVTRSELKIEFDEEKKVITVVTPGENKIVFDDDQKSILIQDQNDNRLEMNEQGIEMSSPKDITIQADGDIQIKAGGNIEVAATQDVKVEGMNVNHSAQQSFSAQGSASAELTSPGQTTVKGSMVMIN